jgi:hypothetical protein
MSSGEVLDLLRLKFEVRLSSNFDGACGGLWNALLGSHGVLVVLVIL